MDRYLSSGKENCPPVPPTLRARLRVLGSLFFIRLVFGLTVVMLRLRVFVFPDFLFYVLGVFRLGEFVEIFR